MELRCVWTDGNNEIFRYFYQITEDYYSSLVGGAENRRGFIPYNLSSDIGDVLLVFCGDIPAGCAGLKRYSHDAAEIKRVWVEPDFRGNGIATRMMQLIEAKALESGYKRTILQTREIMRDAVGLYERLGYIRTDNYPPYDKLDGAVCFAKKL